MDISIIIVNWNTRDSLGNCLASVYEQTAGIEFEVIVVDNASDDGSAAMLKEKFGEVVLIENSENRGFAAANNQGMAIAKGKFFLLLNSDTIICDNAVKRTLDHMSDCPRAGLVGCQVLESQDKVQMTCFKFPSITGMLLNTLGFNRIFKYNRLLGGDKMLWWRRDSSREVDVVSGMFMMVRRAAADEAGLMDESYFLYYEETDWCYRFFKAGWDRSFWSGARIIHVHGGSHSSKQAALKMFVQQQKSCLIYFRKHHGVFGQLTVRLLLTTSFVLRGIGWFLMAMFRRTCGGNSAVASAKCKQFWYGLRFCISGYEPMKG